MLSIEELLKPRFKVSKEGYPDMQFKRNEIIILDCLDRGKNQNYMGYKGVLYYDAYFDQYPSIFRPLAWYEERNFADLPEYIKWSSNPNEKSYFKVENWYLSPNTRNIAGVVVANGHRLFIEDCQPATLSEYNSYIK